MCTDYNNLFEQIDKILEKTESIETLLLKYVKMPKEVPKNMGLEQVLQFLSEEGYEISKSRMYKLTAARKIPHKVFANRLVFNSREVLLWCEQNLKEILTNKNKK